MVEPASPLSAALPPRWTEPVLVCSPVGGLVLSGLAWPRDGLRLSGGLWLCLEHPRGTGWPELNDEPVLIFQRCQDLFVATRVNAVRGGEDGRHLDLRILGQVPV